MLSLVKEFIREEEGMGVIEIVLIIAVLVGMALLFKDKVESFVTNALNDIFGNLNDEGKVTK